MESRVAPPLAVMERMSISFHFGERVEVWAWEAGEPSALARGIRAERTWGAPIRVTCLMRRSRRRRERLALEVSEVKVGVDVRCV